MRILYVIFAVFETLLPCHAQISEIPSLKPSELTQELQIYTYSIPAPRGQIIDRNGIPIAQNEVVYHLESFDYENMLQHVEDAATLLGRALPFSKDALSKHIDARSSQPFIYATGIKESEISKFSCKSMPSYQRYYPHGDSLCHILGYASVDGKFLASKYQQGEPLSPTFEGRDGLELSFDKELTGVNGELTRIYDKNKLVDEYITKRPIPGNNVIITIDIKLQKLCENALNACKRGAIVITDPETGDILAAASNPRYYPSSFVPQISKTLYDQLEANPDIPLLDRTFRSAYPPGSTFKIIVGLAALSSGKISPDDKFPGPASLKIGNTVFKNWKNSDSGDIDWYEALAQSCNTWFYKVGIDTGSHLIAQTAANLGIGQKTGIPLKSETSGILTTDEYVAKRYKRKMFDGDVANLSIGQGDLQISPLQMSLAMGGLKGTLYKARLVKCIMSPYGEMVKEFTPSVKSQFTVDNGTWEAIRDAMIGVVENGTGGHAKVPYVQIAGKTGTAQWGPKNKERTVAWFTGFIPASNPKYCFTAVYEGNENSDIHGGTAAAPMIGKVFTEVYKDRKPVKNSRKE